MAGRGDVSLRHLGWSGLRIERPAGPVLFIDPPAATMADDRPALVLLTHGHPEHVAGTVARLATAVDGQHTVIGASAVVCAHLARRYRGVNATFKPLRPGDRLVLGDGIEVAVFGWRHLPLLPSGIGPALQHVRRLLSRPTLCARIIAAGIRGPRAGPMLGFRLGIGGQRLLVYGEGLHRRSAAAELAAQCRGSEDGTLLVAVEPEDQEFLPALIAASGLRHALLYEPHAHWRDAFGMPRADLALLATALAARGIEAEVLTVRTSVDRT